MSKDKQIYQRILDAIVERQLPPGERLPEDKLAEAFGISRTGVRKVLHRLSLERFVTIEPNKGAHVSRPSKQEAREVFASRALIEPQLMPDVVTHWNASHSQHFRTLVQQESHAVEHGPLSRSIQLTAQFHYELAFIAKNSVLAEFIEQLCYRSSLVIAVYGSQASVSCDCGHHDQLLDLLDNKDSDGAVNWMKRHIEHIQHSLNLEESQDSQIDFMRLFAEEK